jgi:uncharacterized membrane protein
MNLQRPAFLAAILIAAAAAIGVWAFATLPPGAGVPVHFNNAGAATGYMDKGLGLAIVPAIGAVVIAALVLGFGRASPGSGIAASGSVLGVVLIGVAAMFLVSQAAVVLRAMDPDFDLIRWLFLAIGVLFVVVGNVLGKLRHNAVLGVRTRWTLADKRVWDKTHRFTGRLMVLGGVALAVVAMLSANDSLVIGTLVLCAAGPMLAGMIYSRAIAEKPASA